MFQMAMIASVVFLAVFFTAATVMSHDNGIERDNEASILQDVVAQQQELQKRVQAVQELLKCHFLDCPHTGAITAEHLRLN